MDWKSLIRRSWWIVSSCFLLNLIWSKSEADMDRVIMIRRKYKANALLISFSFIYCCTTQLALKCIEQWEKFKRSSNSSEWQQFSRIKRKMHFIYKKLSCFKVAEYVCKKKTSMVNIVKRLKLCNWKSLSSKWVRHIGDLFPLLVMGTDSNAVSQLPLSPCQWQQWCCWWKWDFPGCTQCPKTK